VLIGRSSRLARTLIADDGSPGAEVAREFVRARPHLVGSEARLVGVAVPSTLWPDTLAPLDANTIEMLVESHDAVRRSLAERLEADASATAGPGVIASTVLLDGNPAHEIVEEAERWGADLVVVGSHGRRGLARLALGSVSRQIVHRAHCSVLVVREHAAGAVEHVAETAAPTTKPLETPADPMPVGLP
jgi:nucleotide-binding universal stress UspA family protein